MTVDRSPYALGPSDGPPAVLIHGLTGSPWDLRPIADGLAGQGYRVVAPLIAGHADLEALAASSWRDWYASAERCLVEAVGNPPPSALLLGFSMGSLLALRLAALRPELVRALVVMGVPIEQPLWQRLGARLMVALRPGAAYPKNRSDVRSEAVAQQRAALSGTPYAAVVELEQLQAEVRASLARVRAPTLILHGRYDHVAPVEGSAQVSQALGSSQLRRAILPNSCHHLARDLDRERVIEEILAFAAVR